LGTSIAVAYAGFFIGGGLEINDFSVVTRLGLKNKVDAFLVLTYKIYKKYEKYNHKNNEQ